jgi:SAM-dependent methyltransferase
MYELSSNRVMQKVSIVQKLILLQSRLRRKRSLVVSKFSSGMVLDVGCGPAEIVHYFPEQNNVKYTGIDTNKPEIDGLQKNAQR